MRVAIEGTHTALLGIIYYGQWSVPQRMAMTNVTPHFQLSSLGSLICRRVH